MTLTKELESILLDKCSQLGTSFLSKGGSKVLAQPSNRLLFAKLGPPDQVLGEAESLHAMYQASRAAGHDDTLIPTVHTYGLTPDRRKAYLVTDYKNLRSSLTSSGQRTLGKKLAQMHLHGTSENGMYGFARPTHCGETEQDNTWASSWSDFWADHRIGDLVRRSGDAELISLEAQLREKVYPLLFCPEAMQNIKPAIIHGDLWSGNSGTDETTEQPIIFDPSSSYSHNEAELGIMKMFGGYTSEFFSAYHNIIPKTQPYYNERQDMYEAYHHLNHFVIFGGGYRSGVVRIFKKLISWAENEQRNSRRGDSDGGNGGGSGLSRGLKGGNNSFMSHQGMGDFPCHTTSHLATSDFRPPPGAPGMTTALNPPISVGNPSMYHPQVRPVAPTPSQIADFFSQMICYIWFSVGVPGRSLPTTPSRSPTSMHQPLHSSPLAPRMYAPNTGFSSRHGLSHSKTSSAGRVQSPASLSESSKAMQDEVLASSANPCSVDSVVSSFANDPMMLRLQPKGRFLRFNRDLLTTTQISTSVITLALIYILRLKGCHPHMKGREGSEYRLAISSLMLANKILDDNTYLNKTWAEISNMPLQEVSKMETEFWLGLKMELHVSKEEYDLGLNDLQSLANDRASAIREREAVLKRIAFQQQQKQHNPMISIPNQRIRGPFMHTGWNASSDCVLPPHHHASWHGSRHSLGHIDQFTFPQSRAMYTSESPELGILAHSSPLYQPYTLPSSPLSQASGPPSLAMTSNEALVCSSELEARTPQDATLQSGGFPDPTWQMPSSNAGATMGKLFPPSDTQNSLPVHGMHYTSSPVLSRPPFPTHGQSSSVSYLKRDFERAKLGSLSPAEGRTVKRFASDAEQHTSVAHSPFGSRSSIHVSQFHPSPLSSREMVPPMSPTSMFSSQHSPRHISPYVTQPDNKLYHSSMPSAQTALRPTMSATHVPMQKNQCNSSFVSALTPSSLTAPWKEIDGSTDPNVVLSDRSRGTLQYYSLAAGEPRGVLGTYVPPSRHSYKESTDPSFNMSDRRPSYGSMTISPSPFGSQNNSGTAPEVPYFAGASAYTPVRPASRNDVANSHGLDTFESQTKYPHRAPFSLDPHAWPLASSATSTYLFPYHLLPNTSRPILQ